jgi:DNA-binding transcriptional ArsR family regulator
MSAITTEERLDRAFAALAHPARRAILVQLANGSASVSDLQRPLAMSQPAVSKHLKVLEAAGLIARGRDAQWRPSEVRTEALDDVERWMNEFRRTWQRRLDRFGDYVQKTQTPTQPKK